MDKVINPKPNNISSFSDLIEFVKDRPGHDMRYAINSDKLKSNLSWVPKESFESGLKKTVDWYIKNNIWWQRILSGEYKLKRIGLNDE